MHELQDMILFPLFISHSVWYILHELFHIYGSGKMHKLHVTQDNALYLKFEYDYNYYNCLCCV